MENNVSIMTRFVSLELTTMRASVLNELYSSGDEIYVLLFLIESTGNIQLQRAIPNWRSLVLVMVALILLILSAYLIFVSFIIEDSFWSFRIERRTDDVFADISHYFFDNFERQEYVVVRELFHVDAKVWDIFKETIVTKPKQKMRQNSSQAFNLLHLMP